MKLEGVAAAFRESLGEMEDLDREIDDIAHQILPPNWTPPDDALRRERGAGIKTLQTLNFIVQLEMLVIAWTHECNMELLCTWL